MLLEQHIILTLELGMGRATANYIDIAPARTQRPDRHVAASVPASTRSVPDGAATVCRSRATLPSSIITPLPGYLLLFVVNLLQAAFAENHKCLCA